LQHAAKSCQLPIPDGEAAKNVIGLSIKKAMQSLFPDVDDSTLSQLVMFYSQEYQSKQLGKHDLFPGVFDMLVELRENSYLLAVATGKTRSGLQQALQATETETLFNTTRCADETASKPNPKMLFEILEQTDVANDRTLMVGDSLHDLEMARNANVSFVAVSCGAHSESILQQHNPLLCLPQPANLLAHFR